MKGINGEAPHSAGTRVKHVFHRDTEREAPGRARRGIQGSCEAAGTRRTGRAGEDAQALRPETPSPGDGDGDGADGA